MEDTPSMSSATGGFIEHQGRFIMTATTGHGRTAGFILALAVLVPLGTAGCASMNKTGQGAVIGACAGAAVGAVIGNQTGSTARGAIIGAVVGGTAGAIIGRRMDQQAAELAEQIPGAQVVRIGEGIAVIFDSGLLYDFDSDAVKPAARENLVNLATSLQRHPDSEVLIVGHTDNVGSATYNQGLSERRARSAADVLLAQGVTSNRIRTAGRGLTEPVASNETDAGRAQNRRVEVAIFASEEYRRSLGVGQN
jgi:outer membrane protein OmpA-like peptidoglycan-associated protein